MNNNRRKEIERITERIRSLLNDLSEIKDSIGAVRDEEQEYLDNIPESMQDGEKAQRAQEAVDALEVALSTAEDAETYLDDITNSLDTAKE